MLVLHTELRGKRNETHERRHLQISIAIVTSQAGLARCLPPLPPVLMHGEDFEGAAALLLN